MSPAKSQYHSRVQASKALIARVTVAADDALIDTGQFSDDDFCGACLIDDVVNHAAGVKHPQIPAVPDLALHIHKDCPAGFISMPIGFTAQLGLQCFIEWLEQGGYGLQAASQSSC